MWLGLLEERYSAGKIGCRCGGEAGFRYRREGKLYTIFGIVRYRRAYRVGEECHHGTYPLDGRLGLRPNELSAELRDNVRLGKPSRDLGSSDSLW